MDNKNSKIEKFVLFYTNMTRKKRGLCPLIMNRGLRKIARQHSATMARSKRIWHGDNVRKAHAWVSYNTPIEIILRILSLISSFFLHNLFTRRGSAENVGLMPTGYVKGLNYKIKTCKDLAKAQHVSWMRSEGHRKNILNANFSKIGIGVVKNGKMYYFTQVFYG